jgi:hypothetical protein
MKETSTRLGGEKWRHRELVSGGGELGFHVRIGHAVGEVGTKLGEMIVTHTRLRTADPSRRTRSLRSFVLVRDDSSEKNSARLKSCPPKTLKPTQQIKFSVLGSQFSVKASGALRRARVEGAEARVTCRG